MKRKIVGLCCLASFAAAAQTVVRSFDGDHGPGLAMCETGVTHCGWPDMDAAANGKQVVQATWQTLSVYDYSGRLVKATPMKEFIRNVGLNPAPAPRAHGAKTPGPLEPHVIYDEFIGRWLITVTGLNDVFLVSASSDATGAWGGVYLSCLDGGPCLDLDDAIHLGYDRNGVYTCAVHVGDTNPATIPKVAYDCFAVPAREVEAVAQGKAPAHTNRAHSMPLDAFPAIDHNRHKAADAPAFFMAKTCGQTPMGACQNATDFPFEWVVDSFTWNGATGSWGAQQTVKTAVDSKDNQWYYSKPCCKTQSGGVGIPQAGSDMKLTTNESHRLLNLAQFGPYLYGAMGSGPQGADGNNVLYWFEMNCAKPNACVVSQTAKIAGANFNPEYATVGVDDRGNVGIVAESSTAGTDLSLLLWTHRKADPPNKFEGPVTIVSGTKPYTCLKDTDLAHIGNPVGVLTALDPSDGTKLWTSGQWGNDATPCVWDTRIVEYQIGEGKK